MGLGDLFKKKKKAKARIPVETPEGVLNIEGFERAVTATEIQTLDMLSEGLIDGLVTGEHIFSGNLGDIGWTEVLLDPFTPPEGTDIPWLRSVFWNGIPVVDSNGQFNFQQVSVSLTKGTKNGARLTSGEPNLTVTRSISERLRGAPSEGVLDPNNTDFAKSYRLLNNDITAVNVNIKVSQLFENVVAGEKAGDTNTSEVNYKIYYRPIFSDANKIGDYILGTSEQIIGKITNGYIRSSRITFDTENYINTVQQTLDGQYEDVINDSNSSSNTITALKSLRVEVRKFLEQELVNVFRVSEVFTQEISATILTYQYYGSVDNTQKIIDLNSSVDPTFFQGNVDILTT